MSKSLLFDAPWLPVPMTVAELPVGLAVHRLIHAPSGCPEAVPADRVGLADLQAAGRFEPRDTAARLAGLRAAQADHPDLDHWLVFDTPFFDDLPDVARHYALPAELVAQHGLYRTGRHGPIHRRLARPGRCVSVVVAEVISVAALVDGRPLEVTCGLSALEGVPGEHTVGDIDPAAILYLVSQLGLSLDEVEQALSVEGGIHGLADPADPGFQQRLFVHRLRRAIGSAAAVMDGLDSLVFSSDTDPGFDAQLLDGWTYLALGSSVPIVKTPLTPAGAAAQAVIEALASP